MTILDGDQVRNGLSMPQAIAAVRWAYIATSTGRALMPPRLHVDSSDGRSVTLVMPARVEASPDGEFPESLVVKTVSVFPDNPAHGIPTVLGRVLVLNPSTGEPIGLLDAVSLTAIRTGAGSAVATDALAREDASVLAMFGAGGQAVCQVEGVCTVRNIRTVWLFSRTEAGAIGLRDKLRGVERVPLDVRIARSAAEALADAVIVCTATTSPDPVLGDCDLKPGTHINAIGAHRPSLREIPSQTVCRARVFVDHLQSALAEAGEFIQPIDEGVFSAEQIVGEIGALLAGQVSGRRTADDITLFKSVGIAAQDAVCAAAIFGRQSKR